MLIDVRFEMVPTLLLIIVADLMLTGDMFVVSTGYLRKHDISTLVVSAIILTDLTLHVVVGKHGVVERDARLRRMALPFRLVLILPVISTILVVDAVDVHNALVALTWVSLDLYHSLIATSLDSRLAEASSTTKLIFVLSIAV